MEVSFKRMRLPDAYSRMTSAELIKMMKEAQYHLDHDTDIDDRPIARGVYNQRIQDITKEFLKRRVDVTKISR